MAENDTTDTTPEETTVPTDAPGLVAYVSELDDLDAVKALHDEEATSAKPRVTVVRATEERIAELSEPVIGETLEEVPDDLAWAQLLDDDGKPVERDGKPVAVPLET